jgi:ribonuclease HI
MNDTLFPRSRPRLRRRFTAHCDGGSRGNPGPSGYGAVIEDAKGRVVAELSEFLGIQTNNFAEYSGLLGVLKWAIEHMASKRLRVVSDSELMVKQMQGKYKVASPILRPLFEEARKPLPPHPQLRDAPHPPRRQQDSRPPGQRSHGPRHGENQGSGIPRISKAAWTGLQFRKLASPDFEAADSQSAGQQVSQPAGSQLRPRRAPLRSQPPNPPAKSSKAT